MHTYIHVDDFDVVGLVDIACRMVRANSNADDETEMEGVCFRVAFVVFVEENAEKKQPESERKNDGKNDVERRERVEKNEGKEKRLRARGRRRCDDSSDTSFFFFFTRRTRRNKNDGGDGDERCKKES